MKRKRYERPRLKRRKKLAEVARGAPLVVTDGEGGRVEE